MDADEFREILQQQQTRCEYMLDDKAVEYATEDRLHNFKVAAALQGVSPRQALAGMMAKHTVSVYDMCMSNDFQTINQWTEKITDHINYLILLKALVIEEDFETKQVILLSNGVNNVSQE